MFRGISSIVLIAILFVFASGIDFIVAVSSARSHTRKIETETLDESGHTELITLSIDEFSALEKEKISDLVFEIELRSCRYDVYKTQLAGNNTIVLYAVHDRKEEHAFALFDNAGAPSAKEQVLTPGFAQLQLLMPEDCILSSGVYVAARYTLFTITYQCNFRNTDAPPPDYEFA